MDNDLTVLPVRPDDDVFTIDRDLPDILDRPPFVQVMIGSRGSGKTVMLANTALRSKFYGDRKNEAPVFEDIIIFSGTLGCESSARHLVEKASACYSSYSNEAVDAIIEYQKAKPKEDRRHILIIADDIASLGIKRDDSLFTLPSLHRHFLLSMVFLVQSPRMVPPIVRNCFTSAYIFRMPNASELEKIFIDFSFLGGRRDVKALYEASTNKPYQCMVVDAVGNKVYKWGGTLQPTLLWSKFTEDGGYAPPFRSGKESEPDAEDE